MNMEPVNDDLVCLFKLVSGRDCKGGCSSLELVFDLVSIPHSLDVTSDQTMWLERFRSLCPFMIHQCGKQRKKQN